MTEPVVDNDSVEPLYFGDKRLDAALLDVEAAIYERLGNRQIPVVTAIGLLQRIQWRLMQDMDEDDV